MKIMCADRLKNAIDVAIGGKADMPFCAARVRMTQSGHCTDWIDYDFFIRHN
jgi:hypothetical protein